MSVAEPRLGVVELLLHCSALAELDVAGFLDGGVTSLCLTQHRVTFIELAEVTPQVGKQEALVECALAHGPKAECAHVRLDIIAPHLLDPLTDHALNLARPVPDVNVLLTRESARIRN